jgi:hypothetical protein
MKQGGDTWLDSQKKLIFGRASVCIRNNSINYEGVNLFVIKYRKIFGFIF